MQKEAPAWWVPSCMGAYRASGSSLRMKGGTRRGSTHTLCDLDPADGWAQLIC